MMAFYYCFIFGLLLYNINCYPNAGHNDTIHIEKFETQNFNKTEERTNEEISRTNSQTEKDFYRRNDSITTPKNTEDITETVRQIQPHQIKEDDKKGARTTQTTQEPQTEVITILAETLVLVHNDSKELENIEPKVYENILSSTTSSVKPFSPSPYLGSVIEEVIEEPIAQNRDISTANDFIPMRSRQSFQSFNEENQIRPDLAFYTSSGVIPVQGESYSLHDDTIRQEFDNPDFHENPFGRIKFPDEKSKYFPLFLSDNEIDGRDKPLKFDFDSNYKHYDFPYKIENSGLNPEEVEKDPNISDKTHIVKGNVIINKNRETNRGTVHGADIMKNITTTLPLESKKKKYPPSRHT